MTATMTPPASTTMPQSQDPRVLREILDDPNLSGWHEAAHLALEDLEQRIGRHVRHGLGA
ncbi:hypothetical protein FHR83_006789 [Actinoplanes campanulatus]|uniref:Uncharacterized protein n=1 Tax=Actinoplanes campanulatus TaxID=113559 RepID=A0A7W5FHW2_9ACTN|nr:hypothetical protein [Actinoplanes campanulatus]MBB3099083.1 hypothetical protein [Actinoplanes campanulatus]GGN39119.1 hypothetical protein GCM10010109_66690 [Actinoplanes campanulatus]GID40240.1 hypothetical protein Aca09nite_67460 [Actinoplanes campanulatus]